MRFGDAIDLFIADMRESGRINSAGTEVGYRRVLELHADDVSNRDPAKTGREDCKRTLKRWANPNTQRARRAALVSFYDWAMEEGYRKDNPARQTRRPKARPTSVYRLTGPEMLAMLDACHTTFERRAIHLALLAGLRSAELRGLRGDHFERAGFIHITAEIAKGGRERWVPVHRDLAPVVEEIRSNVARSHHVLPGGSAGGYGSNTFHREHPERGASSQVLQRTVHRIAKRAGIRHHVHPHLLRHAFADHIARHAGLFSAQAMLGHADVRTTQGYTGTATLEELAAAIAHIAIRVDRLPIETGAAIAGTEREGFEPSVLPISELERSILAHLERVVPIYERRFAP